MTNINTTIATRATSLLGNMWTAYILCAVSLISLPAVITSGNIIVIVSWFSQAFIQLVALSILQVGQNINSKESQQKLDVILEKLLENQQIEIQKEDEIIKYENRTSDPQLR